MKTTRFVGGPKEGLIAATFGFFVGFAAVSLFAPTAARFRDVMELDATLVGLLVAMPALSGSILRIPFSAWVEDGEWTASGAALSRSVSTR